MPEATEAVSQSSQAHSMNQEQFDYLGQTIVSTLRKAAGCNRRGCRTELHPLPDGKAQLHHGARYDPRQPTTHQGGIAIITEYTPAFGQSIIRSWRADHGMVDILPERHPMMGSYA